MNNLKNCKIGSSKVNACLATMILVTFAMHAQADYPKDLFGVTQLRVTSERKPHGPDWYLKTREAQAILTSMAAYMGIDPTYVYFAIDAIPSAHVEGEETFYEIPVPSGYAFCAARIKIHSIVPGSGGRASVITSGNRKNGTTLGIYTWTPIRHATEGGSWVDADVQVTGVKPEFLQEFRGKGVCKAPSSDADLILNCSGNCPGVEWGNINSAGRTTRPIAEGF